MPITHTYHRKTSSISSHLPINCLPIHTVGARRTSSLIRVLTLTTPAPPPRASFDWPLFAHSVIDRPSQRFVGTSTLQIPGLLANRMIAGLIGSRQALAHNERHKNQATPSMGSPQARQTSLCQDASLDTCIYSIRMLGARRSRASRQDLQRATALYKRRDIPDQHLRRPPLR